jgi:ABC-type dipeptide/oligopeptide/nickel transport system ATPase component
MPKREKLTEKSVKAAETRGVDYKVYDEEVRGFALTVYASGNRAFCLVYWIKGRQRRCTIGSWPEWSVTAARDRAKALCREIDEGQDPLEQRRDDRAAPRVSDLIDRFLVEHVPHLAPRNAADQTSMMRRLVEPLLERLGLAALARVNPFTLSGGEKRRLSVAAALATAPQLLVLDEPTFGQDARTWREVVTLIASLADDGAGVIAMTHDRDFVTALADEELVLP